MTNTAAAPAPLFDTELVQMRHQRALNQNFNKADFLFDFADKETAGRLELIKRDFNAPRYIGARQSNTLKALLPECQPLTRQDNLSLPPNESDLIVSSLDLHTANDLVGALIQIRHGLIEDGLFLGSLFGGQTLNELRQVLMMAESEIYGGVSPRVAPMIDVKDMSALMQRAGYALPVIDFERVKVSYSDIYALMRDLRGMGESNAIYDRSRKPVSKRFFDLADRYYKDLFADKDGRIEATFEILFVLGWSPSDTQQKPCERGSATTNLADFFT